MAIFEEGYFAISAFDKSQDKMPLCQQQCCHCLGGGHLRTLHQAAFHGDTCRALALLSSGSLDINERAPGGFTPLMAGAQEGNPEIV